jgi:type IV secretory pathway TrbF-like protein
VNISSVIEKSEDRNSTKFRQSAFEAGTLDGLEWWNAIHEKQNPDRNP